MTAQGGDLLAWLESAISERETKARLATQARWRTHDTHLDHGGHTATVLAGERNDTELLAWLPTMSHSYWDEARNAWNNAEHIAANDPASVLRRCAVDRKALSFYSETVAIRDRSAATLRAAQERGAEPDRRVLDDWNRANREAAHMLPLIQFLAEGYGWAEETSLADGQGQTPPTEGDRMT